MKPNMSDSAYAAHRSEMLRQLDFVLRGLVAKTGTQRATLVLVSFSPAKGPSWDQLTPIMIYPAPQPGLLDSPTTRTPGLIAASDFAPTALRLMGLPASDDVIGRAADIAPDARAVEKLTSMDKRVTANQRLLLPVAVAIAVIAVLSFTGSALVIAFGLKASQRMLRLLTTGLVTGACAPAALLVAALAPAGIAGYLAGTAVALIALTVVCVGAGAALSRKTGIRAAPVVLACAATCAIIIADALTGCNLCKFSAPSSYQITGMRFYGIGNEYAGVLIAMAATMSLMSDVGGRRSEAVVGRLIVIIVGAVVVLALGLGGLGANYGAAAAAVVTFGLLWAAVKRGGFGARQVALAFAAAGAAVILFAVLDWETAGGAGTHAAIATGLAEKLGPGYLGSLALRKALFNLKITFSVKGVSVMLAFVPFLALWFWGVQGKVRDLFNSDPTPTLPAAGRESAPSPQPSPPGEGTTSPGPSLVRRGERAGVKAVLIGSAAAFLLNDSGIVFAGTMIAIMMLMLIYSVLEEVEPWRG